MLTKKLACPSCGVGLRVSGPTVAGKQIRCPKCGDTFPVSAGNGARPRLRSEAPPVEEDENPFELVDERPEPRKRRLKKKAKNNTPLIVGVALAGATLLIGAAVTLGVMFWPSGKKTEPVAANGLARSAAGPAGGGSDRLAVGRQVFESNCMRCHSTGGGAGGGGGGRGRNRGPDLARVGQDPTHSVEWLMAFIRDPESRKPGARMPAFEEGKINDGDLRALAEYLASLK